MKLSNALFGATPRPWSAREWALVLLPIALFFSYTPVIPLGTGSYHTHYELSLAELALAGFVLINLPALWRARRQVSAHRAVQLASGFALYASLSVFWSPEPLRAAATSAVIWTFVLSFMSLLSYSNLRQLARPVVSVFIATAVGMSLFALYQTAAGAVPTLSQSTLLCAGCQANQFGFPRPNAFAIEPQFFGSLLLAPSLFLIFLLLRKKQSWTIHLALVLVLLALFLTLSRGALYALVVGMLVLCGLQRAAYKRFVVPLALTGLSLVGALATQGLAAAANPTVGVSFSQAVAVSIHQLTLGTIDIRARPEPRPAQATVDTSPTEDRAIFNGYVARSTNERLDATCQALGIWQQTPSHVLFGTGLGGTGYFFAHSQERSSAPWCKITM